MPLFNERDLTRIGRVYETEMHQSANELMPEARKSFSIDMGWGGCWLNGTWARLRAGVRPY